MGHGSTRPLPGWFEDSRRYRRPLIVDDSIDSGSSMRAARALLAGTDWKPTYLAIYAHKRSSHLVDHYLEFVAPPRNFEWNMWHSPLCERACFDMDGVICPDPSREQNDDGRAYLDFVSGAPALVRPTRALKHIVTSRLERYRSATEEWLRTCGIAYENLHMLDLPSASQRRRLGIHASFKASVYRGTESWLFVESDSRQAESIAELSGRPVLDYSTKRIVKPESASIHRIAYSGKRLQQRIARRLQALRLFNSGE